MNAHKEIVTWLEERDPWLQEAAFRLLSSDELTDDDHTDLLVLLKSDPDSYLSPSFPVIGAASQENDELRLSSMGPVNGINALNSRNALRFGEENLCVVYGNNATGKSSYCRILSNVSGKPNAPELRPNVFMDQPEKQSCCFGFERSGQVGEEEWHIDEPPLEALKAIEIFDTYTGQFYLEDETELTYVPPELLLFSKLVEVCQTLKARLQAEQDALACALPTFPSEWESTTIATYFKSLSAATDTVQLEAMLNWKEADEAALSSLNTRLGVPDAAEAARKSRDRKKQLELIEAELGKCLAVFKKEELNNLNTLKANSLAKQKIAEESAAALKELTPVDGVGKTTWRALWEAARTFSKTDAYPDEDYPYTKDEARCVLCQQTLDQVSAARLQKLEDFVQGVVEKEARVAEADYQSALESIPSRPSEELLIASSQAAGLTEKLTSKLESFWQVIEEQLELIRASKMPGDQQLLFEKSNSLLKELKELAQAAEKEAVECENDAKASNRPLLVQKHAELAARKWLSQQADAMRNEIKRLKTIEQLNQWQKKIATRGITVKADTLSEQLVTEAYIARFNEELVTLGASKVRVELVKTRAVHGAVRHRINLKAVAVQSASVDDILSEGERRIVALAAFLAETTGVPRESPVVFDDPVSSLSQDYEERVVARLIALCENRQILVFTHRLSLLVLLREAAKKANQGVQEYHLRNEPWGAGEPGELSLFATNTTKSLNSLLNQRLSLAKKVANEEGQEVYYPLGKALCSDTREILERIVEVNFMADVVQRFRRAVNTQGKIAQLAKITPEDCKFVDRFMTKYSRFEHSQPHELPVEVPNPDELESDLTEISEWLHEFNKRQVPA